MHRRFRSLTPPLRSWGAKLAVAAVAVTVTATVARAEWGFGVAVDEGVSVLGGPLSYRMASPDGVTGASVDAVTTASRPSHAGGVHLEIRHGEGSGRLLVGLEYVHYRFDIDTGWSRAQMDVVGARLVVLARLVLMRLRRAPLLSFGAGGYLEATLWDRGELAGEQLEVELSPLGAGLVIELRLEPILIELSRERGRLVPGLFLRGYRGLVTQLRDELGSEAPLSSFTLGVGLRYELPESSQGNGRSGR